MFDLREYFEFLEEIKVRQKAHKKVNLNAALGRILANDMRCAYDIPRFCNSAMDGFALRVGHKQYEIIENIFAGSAKKIELKNNEAVRITTGAKIPRGAQAVVQKELSEVNGNILSLRADVAQNQCIKMKGEDFKKMRFFCTKVCA